MFAALHVGYERRKKRREAHQFVTSYGVVWIDEEQLELIPQDIEHVPSERPLRKLRHAFGFIVMPEQVQFTSDLCTDAADQY